MIDLTRCIALGTATWDGDDIIYARMALPALAKEVQQLREEVRDGIAAREALVWVRTPEGDESLLETLKKLAADADVTWANQRKVFVATRAERLMDEGFEFFKDCFEGEPEAHYCVRLPALEAAAVDRFLQAFDAEHSVADLGVTDDSR